MPLEGVSLRTPPASPVGIVSRSRPIQGGTGKICSGCQTTGKHACANADRCVISHALFSTDPSVLSRFVSLSLFLSLSLSLSLSFTFEMRRGDTSTLIVDLTSAIVSVAIGRCFVSSFFSPLLSSPRRDFKRSYIAKATKNTVFSKRRERAGVGPTPYK